MTRYKCDPGKSMIQKINQVLYERQSTVLMRGIKKKTDNLKRINMNVMDCNKTSHNRGREEVHSASCLALKISSESESIGGPEGHDIGHSRKKTTETESHSSLPTVYTCEVSIRSIPGKIWMTTNQITAVSACACVSRELRARALQDLGIYKESRVAYRAIRVRVS